MAEHHGDYAPMTDTSVIQQLRAEQRKAIDENTAAEAALDQVLSKEQQRLVNAYGTTLNAAANAGQDVAMEVFFAHFPAQSTIMRLVWEHADQTMAFLENMGCDCPELA